MTITPKKYERSINYTSRTIVHRHHLVMEWTLQNFRRSNAYKQLQKSFSVLFDRPWFDPFSVRAIHHDTQNHVYRSNRKNRPVDEALSGIKSEILCNQTYRSKLPSDREITKQKKLLRLISWFPVWRNRSIRRSAVVKLIDQIDSFYPTYFTPAERIANRHSCTLSTKQYIDSFGERQQQLSVIAQNASSRESRSRYLHGHMYD